MKHVIYITILALFCSLASFAMTITPTKIITMDHDAMMRMFSNHTFVVTAMSPNGKNLIIVVKYTSDGKALRTVIDPSTKKILSKAKGMWKILQDGRVMFSYKKIGKEDYGRFFKIMVKGKLLGYALTRAHNQTYKSSGHMKHWGMFDAFLTPANLLPASKNYNAIVNHIIH